MSIQNLTIRFLQFNLWANERLTSWLLTLDQRLLYAQTKSSFGSIDRTLQHILSGQHYWYTILSTGYVGQFGLPLKDNAVHQVIDDLIVNSKQLIDIALNFREQQLIDRIQVSDSTQSRYEYILHLVNHSSYHRGQIVTLCRALGITEEIPVTDYDAYLWWIENMHHDG